MGLHGTHRKERFGMYVVLEILLRLLENRYKYIVNLIVINMIMIGER